LQENPPSFFFYLDSVIFFVIVFFLIKKGERKKDYSRKSIILQKARDTVHRAEACLKDWHTHARQATERDASICSRHIRIRPEQFRPQIRIAPECCRVGGNVLRDAVPPRRTQGLVGREGVAIVVRLPGRVFELPRHVAGRRPRVGVGDVSVVGDRVDNGEGVMVDQVVAKAGVVLLIGCDRRHDVGDGGGRVGGFVGRVVRVDNAEFVLMGVPEEGAANGIVEAVDDGVPESCQMESGQEIFEDPSEGGGHGNRA
jgi:hypothetical protein